jgi:aminoglycoside phosphotransferase family enzyme/predicted kinase
VDVGDSLSAAQIESLGEARAHPHDPTAAGGVQSIQTHISHVFLTPARVYKLRKAVDVGFLDFSGRAARNADCQRELALNRRFSPDVYLGVAPLLVRDGLVEVGRVGDALWPDCEHVVVMRRLPEGCDALTLLERGVLGPREIDLIAERIATFHSEHGLGAPAPFAPADWLERIAAPMRANIAGLRLAARRGIVASREVDRLAGETDAALARGGPRLEARRAEGRAVDGHGDLHLQHIWLEDAADGAGSPRITLIDCIEFSDAWRQIDVASEVAFLAMDLRYRAAPILSERLLRKYAALRDDFGLYGVIDLFGAYRAAVRAKVAALAAEDPAIAAEQRERAVHSTVRHLTLALEYLVAPTPAPLVVVCGSVGSGKSTVAQRLADACEGVVISSDRTRKALAGLAPESRAQAAEGSPLYSEAMSAQVYAGLLARAAPVIASGRLAILDATFSRAAQRSAAREFARQAGVRALLVEVRCEPAVARERVALRALRGGDPSDAGPERVEPSRAAFEPTGEWPGADRVQIDTDHEAWADCVQDVAKLVVGG